MAQIGDIWYRYIDRRYSTWDPWNEESNGSYLKIDLLEFTVTKVTPKGVKLDGSIFVLASANKHYACATKEEARVSFIARKTRQAAIYQARLNDALAAIQIVSNKPCSLFEIKS